jgi:hypothetical protein
MAVINKDFKVKNGLIVEGASGTINNQTILTEVDGDEYILDLVGGVAFITSVDEAQLDVTEGELSVKTEVFDEFGAAAAAQEAAEDYADGLAVNYDAAGAAAAAQEAAEDYADGLAVNYDAAGSAAAAQTAAEQYADGLAVNYDAAGAAAAAQEAAEDYADGLAVNYEVSGAVGTHSDLTTGVHGVTGDVVGTSDAQTLTNKTMGDDLLMNGFQVSGLGTPTQADHAATKSYVDSVAEGLHVHASVAALADSNVSLPTAPATVDGVTLSVNDRVLLVGQTAPAENGIYVVINGDLARAADYNTAGEIQAGDFVFVSGGSDYASTGWVQENSVTTLGTDPIEWTQFSGAGTYLAGNGINLDGNTFTIDETITATRTFASDEASAAQEAAEDYADGLAVNYDAAGSAAAAQTAAEQYADGLAVNYDAAGAAAAAQEAAEDYADGLAVNYDAAGTAQGIVDALDTDDIEEGTAQYFTDVRAKTSAADLLTGATLENITITGDENGLTITAENGVADSDTDDLTEGSSNLYFTDQRAVDALEAVTPNFVEIDINSIATQIAATVEVATASTVTAHAFPKADYRSAEYLVKVAYGTHTEISKVLLTLDTSDNIAITEYAIVGTNGSASTISADVSGTDVRLRVATVNNSSDVTVVGTLVA